MVCLKTMSDVSELRRLLYADMVERSVKEITGHMKELFLRARLGIRETNS